MIISFEEALHESLDCDRTILLGNGFSIAGADKAFSYQNILQSSVLPEGCQNVFHHLETSDFEVVINKLEIASSLLEVYKPEQADLIEKIKNDSRELRQCFSEAIAKNHALYSEALKVRAQRSRTSLENIEIQTRRNCIKFLSNFKRIFTTNYDLLLYWIINYYLSRRLKLNIPHFDGFSRISDSDLLWIGDRDRQQDVFFLHGSLLFYQVEDILYKIEQVDRDEDGKHIDLLSIVQQNILEKRTLPLIVFEGSSARKIEKISEHWYLAEALNNLKNLNGSLFIFGHSLDPSDDHILNKIKESKINKIFVSIYDEDDENRFRQRANAVFLNSRRDREIQLFKAESANVWID